MGGLDSMDTADYSPSTTVLSLHFYKSLYIMFSTLKIVYVIDLC